MKTNRIIAVVAFVLYAWALNAQIGYQVSLLNTATGEPRANETVSVTVEIINSQNTVICSETKSATTDDFGVLSLQVGTANTFKDVDWSKLPLYVSATVDGIMVGKSQILNVPVAEAAKTLVNVDLSLICKTWTSTTVQIGVLKFIFIFNNDMTYTYQCWSDHSTDGSGNWVLAYNGNSTYDVVGNTIYLLGGGDNFLYSPASLFYHNGHLYGAAFYGPIRLD